MTQSQVLKLRTIGGRNRRPSLSGGTRIGAAILLLIGGMAIFAPLLTQSDPLTLSGQTLLAPSLSHLMGTDDLGRDVFSRVLYGGRLSLVVGLVSAAIAIVLGIVFGVIAGYSGGAIDEALMRVTEVFQIVPRLLVAIVVASMVGGGIGNVILIIGLLSWPPTARLVRAQVLAIRREDFISAAIMSGASYVRIVRKQIIGNIMPILLVSASMQVASAILAESALSFLGLGDASQPSWGQMLQQSQGFLRQAWWMSVFPGVALALTIVALNVLSDGLSDRLPGAAK